MTNPTLRFNSELCNAFPDWGTVKIKDLSGKMIGGGTPDKNNLEFWTGSVPWISSSDLSLDNINTVKITRFISDSALKNSATKLVPKGSVLIVSRVGVGKVAVAPCDLCTSQDFANLINIKSDSFFLAYALKKHMSKKLNEVQGTSIKGITSREIKESSISIPCLEEQQKIASFFSTLDQKIELNERKLEALEKLKKGLMQKIFNREIRFKQGDGSDFPKWNNKHLGEVACLNNGRAYKQEELLNEGKYIVLRVGNFFTNEKYYYSNMELESCKYAHKGDLLYCWSASFGPKIWDGEKVIYHYHIWKIDQINIDKNYLYYYLQRDVANLEQEMNGGTMMHLTKANMEQRFVGIPVVEEQTKIASLFIYFDKKTELVLAEINSLKKLKQGFMQKMFV